MANLVQLFGLLLCLVAGFGMAIRIIYLLSAMGPRAQPAIVRALSIGSAVFFAGWLMVLIGGMMR